MNRHDVTFNLLADENYKYFSKYDVKTSIWGMLRATIFRFIRTNIAISKGYIPFPIKGYFNIMPVDILIDEKGVVKQVKYAKDIGDHLSLDEIIKFSN
jgi:thioredoxin-dependent peroxiredoxin